MSFLHIPYGSHGEQIVLATDGLDLKQCLGLVEKIGPNVKAVKIHDIADRYSVESVCRQLKEAGAQEIWIDYKLDDIPRTNRRRAEALAACGANFITVHCQSGVEAMMAANETRAKAIGVTVLTSLDEAETGLLSGHKPLAAVLERARMAALAKLYGFVCSPLECSMVAAHKELNELNLFVPACRLPGQAHQDQKRVDTYESVIRATYRRSVDTFFVVGSHFTNADDPVAAYRQLEEELQRVWHLVHTEEE
jgi:orotidine-5'-phosphate decarboxylase